MKDCQQAVFPFATARREIYSKVKQHASLGRSEMDSNRSNCQADSGHFTQKDEKGLDGLNNPWGNGKHTSIRRQEKHRSKLEHFDSDPNDLSRERGPTIRSNRSSQLLNGYQTIHEEQRRLYENEIRMAKEIHKKQILLQEKLLKAAESLRKFQLRNESEDKVKSGEQRNVVKTQNRLCYTEKGNWDWESARDRALGGRRHEGQRDGFDNWLRGNDGLERQENHVKEINAGQNEKRRELIDWENIPKTTKTADKEWDHFEEMTKHTLERGRTKKDKTRKERAMEWQGNEMRDWGQRDWQEKETVRFKDGEKRGREQAKLKRDTDMDNEAQQWDLMDKFASDSHIKGKAVSKHEKTNVFIEDHFATQERGHQYSNRAAEEMPLPEAGPNTDTSKTFEQVQIYPDTDLQLVPCKVCNRHFREDRLERHISICQKTKQNQRQVFSSSQHRVKGTEIERFLKTNGRSKTPEPKKNNSRLKQPSADLNSDYVTCPYCSRRFAPGPAERHIPKCQNIKSKPPPPKQCQ